MNRNAIIAFAVGNAPEELNLFIRSLATNVKQVDLILFVGKNISNWKQTYKNEPWIKINRFRQNFFIKAFSKIIKKNSWVLYRYTNAISSLHIKNGRNWLLDEALISLLQFMCKRFVVAERVLKTTSYEKYMLTDARDVIFQSDPFQEIGSQQIITGGEPKKIYDCSFNKQWLHKTFLEENLEDVVNKQILCAGVTIGSKKVIGQYLNEMIEVYYNKFSNIVDLLGPDQAIHNWLFHKGLQGVEKKIQNNGEGTIATLHYSNLSEFQILEQQVLNNNNKPLHILHQFDRKVVLVNMFTKMYLSKKSLR